MAESLPDLSKHLAANLLELRQRQNLSQSGLAKLASLPRSTVTHFESGSGNPSLANLGRLAAALQVPLEELLSKPRPSCLLVKAADIKGRARNNGAARIWSLLPDHLPGLDIEKLDFAPQGRFTGVPHTSGTREYLFVLKGKLRLTVGGESHDLDTGDLLAFPGDQAHSYANREGSSASALSVVARVPVGT